MQPLILNSEQTQFLTDQIFSLFPNCELDYKKDWQEKIASKNGNLALILQKIYPGDLPKILSEFQAKYPDLDYDYVIDFLGLDSAMQGFSISFAPVSPE